LCTGRRSQFPRSLTQWICALSLCCSLTACVKHRPVHVASSPDADLDYVDFNAKWRIRVVVPILRIPGYIVPTTGATTEGHILEFTADKEYVGYETEYYSVFPRRTTGVRLKFASAEDVIDGKTSLRTQPRLQMFNLPPDIKYIRLVHLIRESGSDHNMVIVGAINQNTLALLTASVISSDSRMCSPSDEMTCIPVPQGIAVVPEEKTQVNGRAQWRPVR